MCVCGCSHSLTGYNTKGTRAHTHRELIRKCYRAAPTVDWSDGIKKKRFPGANPTSLRLID